MITEQDIKADITRFEERLQKAQLQMILLAPSGDTPKTRYKRQRQRIGLTKEIIHVKGLVAMAQKALPGGEWD